jgi:hypothetical protein
MPKVIGAYRVRVLTPLISGEELVAANAGPPTPEITGGLALCLTEEGLWRIDG